MYIKNQKASLIYKTIAVLLCLSGQILVFIISDFGLGIFLYYTNLSNILCLVYFILAASHCYRQLKTGDESAFAPRFKGAVVLAITVTMLVYWLVLRGGGFSMGTTSQMVDPSAGSTAYSVMDMIVHLLVPLTTIFDWLLFDPKGSYKRYDPVLWLGIPLIYYGLTIVIAQTGFTFIGGVRYPYFFINPDLIGYQNVALFVAGIILAFLMIGYLLYGLDRLLGKRQR